jgi:hypothetical protein
MDDWILCVSHLRRTDEAEAVPATAGQGTVGEAYKPVTCASCGDQYQSGEAAAMMDAPYPKAVVSKTEPFQFQ